MTKIKQITLLVTLIVPIVLGACGSSGTTTTSTTTTTVRVASTTQDSSTDYVMTCTPGACDYQARDDDYLEIVKQNLTPLFLSTATDADLFSMASVWCKAVNEPGGWPKIKSFIQDKYDKGLKDEYNLNVWSLLGASAYCFGNQKEISDYVGSLRQL